MKRHCPFVPVNPLKGMQFFQFYSIEMYVLQLESYHWMPKTLLYITRYGGL